MQYNADKALVSADAPATSMWQRSDMVPRLWPNEPDLAAMWARNEDVDPTDFGAKMGDYIQVCVTMLLLVGPVVFYLSYVRGIPQTTVDRWGTPIAPLAAYPLSWVWRALRITLTRWKLRRYSFARAQKWLLPRARAYVADKPNDTSALHFLRGYFERVPFAVAGASSATST